MIGPLVTFAQLWKKVCKTPWAKRRDRPEYGHLLATGIRRRRTCGIRSEAKACNLLVLKLLD
jgi:hypothetical protein